MIRGTKPVRELRTPPAPSLIPLPLAAEWFGLTRETLLGLIASGRVRAEKIRGQWSVSPDDVEAVTDTTVKG
jgi:hypothetical protein